MIRILLLFLFLISIPTTAAASVTINEVAWMGSSVSPNHEWIELYNSGPAVDVEGWTVTDSESLEINLSGIIEANSYAVLERTSDDSASGPAFLIYTGSLKNTGETLYLRRANGSLEDQVAGGENWQNIGGDNVTKTTAQYTTNGWISAEATPGEINVQKTQIVEVSSVSVPQGSARLASPAVRTDIIQELVLPDVTLQLAISAPTIGYVNQPLQFEVTPKNVGKAIQNSLSYDWNFGNTQVATGKEVEHTFLYPGTYVVHVSGAFARQHATGRHEITILPVSFSLTQNAVGDIQVNNDSPYEIDISNYRLRAAEVLQVPQNTLLLSNQTITIPKHKVGYQQGLMVGLYDAAGDLVASVLPTKVDKTAPPSVQRVDRSQSSLLPPRQFQFVSEEVVESEEMPSIIPTVQAEEIHSVDTNKTTSKPQSNNWVFGAMIALLLVAIIAILMKPLSKSEG